jgi:hypothetical protein
MLLKQKQTVADATLHVKEEIAMKEMAGTINITPATFGTPLLLYYTTLRI